ncbi:MAG: hypothetical protein L0Y56_05490, partial [Nitrospira sp.]|nr:hypothetical protein [Nitrospira sp.]
MSKDQRDNLNIVPSRMDEDTVVDVSLRPQGFSDYIGQDRVKENLHIFIEAAKRRGEALDHALFYGP